MDAQPDLDVCVPDATKEDMTRWWGEKCKDFDIDCAACRAWGLWEVTQEMWVTVDRAKFLQAAVDCRI